MAAFLNENDSNIEYEVVEKSADWKHQGYSIVLWNNARHVLEKIGLEKFRLFIQGQNLLIITDYKGLDPEMEILGNDYNGAPRSRIFTVGLNVGF